MEHSLNIIETELKASKTDPRVDQILKLAIMAVGGQGGGVLANWIDKLCRSQGYACQATSVAGVAQRTGATIYYIEMAPQSDGNPVFSLAPAAGDVDILIASEMMEVGRAIMRGFVTPDRTTLIGSTHRALAVSEKTIPGDGIAKSSEVYAAAEIAAKKLILMDMDKIAVEAKTVVSASLFGSLAASNALPFPKEAFEESIRSSGKGVEASLKAFHDAYQATINPDLQNQDTTNKQNDEKKQVKGPKRLMKEWEKLVSEINLMPSQVQEMASLGLQKVVDFQDVKYGQQYLNYLKEIITLDENKKYILSIEAAKHIANAMAYDDIIKVADLKTRANRTDRILNEMNVDKKSKLRITEYFHPRAEEIVGLFPKRFGNWYEKSSKRMNNLDRLFNKGRRIKSTNLSPFFSLFLLAGLRGYRVKTYRHQIEFSHREKWIETFKSLSSDQYDLAVEIVKCRRLIKGYSDTHSRGLSKFDKVMNAVNLVSGRADAAKWIERLREAALLDENGEALDGAIKTIETIT